ncbi:MAG: hypothetical protein BGO26_08015 [Actinobacteria bacterium 69-20]|nr:MAG: hypothetical protein BGO26_08015 [Actinobacteria bacterium 69-20]
MSKSRLLVAAPRITVPVDRRRRPKMPTSTTHGSIGPENSCSTGPATAAQPHADQHATRFVSHSPTGSSSSSMNTSASASADSASALFRAAEMPGSGSWTYRTPHPAQRATSDAAPASGSLSMTRIVARGSMSAAWPQSASIAPGNRSGRRKVAIATVILGLPFDCSDTKHHRPLARSTNVYVREMTP